MENYSDAAIKTFQYIMSLNTFREACPEEYKPSWVKISTITMISTYKKAVNYAKLRDIFTKLGSITLKMEKSKTDGFEWQLKHSAQFMNQVTLWYKDVYSTKSIKVFSNGSLQVAGCSDILDCLRIINQLNYLLKELDVIDEIAPLTSYRIVMINTNFSLNYNVNVLKIIQHFSSSPIFNVTFEPDKYSAVKIKFKPAQDMKEVTVSIFGTGKIIITGAETLQEIALAYNTIIQQVITHRKDILVSKNPSECRVFMGYLFDDWIPTLTKLGVKPWTFARINNPVNF